MDTKPTKQTPKVEESTSQQANTLDSDTQHTEEIRTCYPIRYGIQQRKHKHHNPSSGGAVLRRHRPQAHGTLRSDHEQVPLPRPAPLTSSTSPRSNLRKCKRKSRPAAECTSHRERSRRRCNPRAGFKS